VTVLRINPETGKWRYTGVMRAHDVLATKGKPGEQQHVTFTGRGIDTPLSTDFQPLVQGSRAPQLGFHPKVWYRRKRRVKGGYEVEGHYEATH
jgi:hypothetical protein